VLRRVEGVALGSISVGVGGGWGGCALAVIVQSGKQTLGRCPSCTADAARC
jgi:hypothetical protein